MKKAYIQQFETFVKDMMTAYGGRGIGIIGFDSENVLYEHYEGYRDVEKKLPIDRDTIFGIASITKSFTVLGVLKLVENGIIDLHMPINHYIQELKLPEAQMPTVEQLLSHAAGFYPQERFLMKDVAVKLGIEKGEELSKNNRLAGMNRKIAEKSALRAFFHNNERHL